MSKDRIYIMSSSATKKNCGSLKAVLWRAKSLWLLCVSSCGIRKQIFLNNVFFRNQQKASLFEVSE
jgi:hypothetical protein